MVCIIWQKQGGVQKYSEIGKLVAWRMDNWEVGHYTMLVHNAIERGGIKQSAINHYKVQYDGKN